MTTSTPLNTKIANAEHDIADQIEALRNDLAQLSKTITDDMTRSVENAGNKIGEASRDAQKTATNAVLDHPLTAIGVAAGIGLLLGLVVRKG